jgi:hypothetical protein
MLLVSEWFMCNADLVFVRKDFLRDLNIYFTSNLNILVGFKLQLHPP